MTQDAFKLAKRFRLSLDSPGSVVASDADVLQRFLLDRNEEAFAQLVHRHGPLVWGLCRRTLNHDADAEDAFQATFLALFQHAGRIQKQGALTSWLYGAAWRITHKIKRTRHRAKQRELQLARPEEQSDENTWDQTILKVMDAELARLPAHYREPLLLCYLQGQSHALAAQTLGWPIGTVAGRLSRAKELLRSRLIRRGVAPAIAVGLGVDLAQAQLPTELIEKTLQTIHAGGTSTVTLLAKGAVTTMFLTKWLMAGTIGLGLTLGAGWCYSAWQGKGEGKQEAGTENKPVAEKQTEQNDYQLIQGQWRYENRHEVTNTLLSVEDLTFRGRKYARSTYAVEKGAIGERNYESDALDYVLDPKQLPKRLELQEQDIKKHKQPQFGERFYERYLCTYELNGDVLTIYYRDMVVLLGTDKGEIVPDPNLPQATFPRPGDPNVRKQVYRRIHNKTVNDPNATDPTKTVSDLERKLLDEQLKACEDVVKFRLQAYIEGRATVDYLLDAIKKRTEIKLDLADNNSAAMQAVMKEAITAAREAEARANAKYKAGSATLLEPSAAKVERLNYELRLLRLEKSTKP